MPRLTSYFAASAALALSSASSTLAASWSLSDTYAPQDFLSTSKWTYFTDKDPTNGLVTYQSAPAAQSMNLTGVQNDEFYLRVDTTKQQLAGRPSVRITSVKDYSDGVYVLDASHMPVGCSVWPAWWTLTAKIDGWPVGGEIDIVENANDQYNSNLASLHTKAACNVSGANDLTGTVAYPICNSDTGCRVEMNNTSGAQAASTGPAFNTAGGGIYAMERSLGSTGNGVRVWFFPRGSEPSDLKDGSNSVNPSGWGTPGAHFPVAKSCHSQFDAHNIVFDITLCGDWASNTFAESGCAAKFNSCSYMVGYQGDQYEDAYWSVKSVRVFASGGSTDNAANSPNTSPESEQSGSATTTSGALTLSSSVAAVAGIASLAVWCLLA